MKHSEATLMITYSSIPHHRFALKAPLVILDSIQASTYHPCELKMSKPPLLQSGKTTISDESPLPRTATDEQRAEQNKDDKARTRKGKLSHGDTLWIGGG